MNLSGTFNVFRLFFQPALCLPHLSVPTVNDLQLPLNDNFTTSAYSSAVSKPDIRAVVLDKDNCFAVPYATTIHPAYEDKIRELCKRYPTVIVSNSAGTNSDPGFRDAEILEKETGIKVLRHSTKKPGCGHQIMEYFRSLPHANVTKPSQVAVIGDRLFTDILLANLMGAVGIWIREGVVPKRNVLERLELRLAARLMRKGWQAPFPRD